MPGKKYTRKPRLTYIGLIRKERIEKLQRDKMMAPVRKEILD